MVIVYYITFECSVKDFIINSLADLEGGGGGGTGVATPLSNFKIKESNN